MSSLFISHSGRDNKVAAEIMAWLEEQGYRAVFLDLDPKTGIPAGSDWEREIYRALERCRAVILLCSKHSMASRWCFAEIAHTRALGKPIFPLLVSECEVWPELLDTQFVDLAKDKQGALERLATELDRVVKDHWRLPWTPNGPRSPYPGLLSFEKEDAAIFFGRDEEIRRGLELLNQMRRFPGARLAVVVGASSSGKSSLLRAGLLPRIERDRRNWLALDPFRPVRQPFVELALALAAAFERAGAKRSREEIQASLRRAAEQEPVDGAVLVGLARELLTAAGQAGDDAPSLERAAAVLVPIDQLEELLGISRGEEAEPFLRLLRSALENEQSPLVVIATLRSDFLGAFQQDAEVGGMRFRGLPLGAMSEEGFRQVIEGPAEIDGLELEEGLVDAMMADTETAEALPLLAFALGELYQMVRESKGKRVLGLTDYRDRLGGLATAVGRAADAVLEENPLSGEDEQELRRALVSLVSIDSQGRYARRQARWSTLPARVHPILERFVGARLLTSGGDGETRTVELRHEALFRTWTRMIRWLDEDREFLLWRKRVEALFEQWESSDRAEAQLLQGATLAEAVSWHERRPQEDLAEFILTSAKIARRTRNRKLGLAASLIAVLAVLVSMIMSANLQTAKIRNAWERAEGARRSAELAEDEAIALAQRARMKEQQAKRLLGLVCKDRDVDDCQRELEGESAGE